LYFIKSGKVKVLRKVDFRIPEHSWQHSDISWLSSNPNSDDYKAIAVESKLLDIDELHNGDYFGEDCVVLRKPIKNSLITGMPTEILTLDAHDFLIMGPEVQEHCLVMQKAYPDDVDLRRAFIEMNRWTKFKKDVMHTVQSESLNKKKGYENTMRKPVLVPVKMPIKVTS
jgi:hypothetical protein